MQVGYAISLPDVRAALEQHATGPQLSRRCVDEWDQDAILVALHIDFHCTNRLDLTRGKNGLKRPDWNGDGTGLVGLL
jgi:hypothetical protein